MALSHQPALDPDDLYDRWARLFPDATPKAIRNAYNDVANRYDEPHRHYHTLAHVYQMLQHLDEYPTLLNAGEPRALELAVWLHDVIYDIFPPTGIPSNENRSAEYAMLLPTQLDLPWETRFLAGRLIIATTDHLALPGDLVTATLLDADLSILGSDPETYQRYVTQVRTEYQDASETAWAAGRATVLRAFLARPSIFYSPLVANDLEAQARANLTAELSTLDPKPVKLTNS